MECRHIYGITKRIYKSMEEPVDIVIPDSLEDAREKLKKIDFRFNYCPLCGQELDWSWTIEKEPK